MSTEIRPRRIASVYLLYDADDQLLYVGMTCAGMNRFNGHIEDKGWWRDVVRAEFHHCGTEHQARRTEAVLIRDLNPVYNRVRPANICRVCQWERARGGGRCEACSKYFKRHGVERPEELIVRHGQRIVARQAEKSRAMR